jgi:hypothetical protein
MSFSGGKKLFRTILLISLPSLLMMYYHWDIRFLLDLRYYDEYTRLIHGLLTLVNLWIAVELL